MDTTERTRMATMSTTEMATAIPLTVPTMMTFTWNSWGPDEEPTRRTQVIESIDSEPLLHLNITAFMLIHLESRM